MKITNTKFGDMTLLFEETLCDVKGKCYNQSINHPNKTSHNMISMDRKDRRRENHRKAMDDGDLQHSF